MFGIVPQVLFAAAEALVPPPAAEVARLVVLAGLDELDEHAAAAASSAALPRPSVSREIPGLIRGLLLYRRGYEEPRVYVVEAFFRDQLAHRIRRAPLVLNHRVVHVVDMRVPGVLVQLLELGGVLDRVAVRVEEVAEGVVAG